MWYHQIYFNRRDWLIDNYHRLDLTSDELLLLLIIDGANQQSKEITYDYLKEATKLTVNKIDKCIANLTKLNYLKIKPIRKRIDFNIDGVFRKEFEQDLDKPELLSLVEDSFGRLLSQTELKTLTSLTDKVEYDVIVYAIRQAVFQNKLTMSYLEKVALNESSSTS